MADSRVDTDSEVETLSVRVDIAACEGHGQCMFAAPEVFTDLDDEGKIVYVAAPPASARAAVEEAARMCPTGAIHIEEPAPVAAPAAGGGEWVEVCDLAELKEREIKRFDHGEHHLIITRAGEEVSALQAICTHARAFLGPGYLTKDCLIECPMHEAWFRLDGEIVKGPPEVPLPTYPVEIRDGAVFVEIPAGEL